MSKATLCDAIEALIPNEIFIISVIDGKEVVKYENPNIAPTEEQIQAKLSELQAEYDANEYQRQRAAEYPSWQDQLDKIYHEGIDVWKAEIKAIKDKYPKS